MQLGYVLHYVPDVAAAGRFYEQAFGLKVGYAAPSGQYVAMDTGATTLGFVDSAFVHDQGIRFTALDPKATPPGIEVALVTDDVPGAVKRATDAGATLVQEPHVKPWGQTVAFVRDLNGAIIELCTKIG